MTIKILTACAALALVGCASNDRGSSTTSSDQTYGTGSNMTNSTNNASAPHQGQGAEQQQNTSPNSAQGSGNRPL